MALKNCRECGKPVSTQARACPHCGAKAPKTTSKTAVFFGSVFAVIVATMVFRGNDAPVAAAAGTQAPKSQEDARFDLAYDAAKAIKGAMRDPDSVKFEYIGVNADATVACVKYRARNGFGGMNAEFAVVANNKATSKKADWQKYCIQPLQDQTAAAG